VWHFHGLKALGIIACIDARHAKAALTMQVNKTDENDAEGIAQIMRTGWFREVHVKSFEAQMHRSLLQCRLQLVNMRRDTSNQVRGALKVFGIVLPPGRLATFDRSKARVAVARKLAIIMHRMWCTGEAFRWGSVQEVTV
jgi:transposase